MYKDFILENQQKWEEKNRSIYSEYKKNIFVWYTRILDSDHKIVLGKYRSNAPSKICDVGTCSGDQAIAMATLGHSVTGIDVSETALEQARKNAQKNALRYKNKNIDITFLKDDILESKLESKQFDLIIDRGCFHSFYNLAPVELYIDTIKRLLKPNGIFMVKVMSNDEERYRNFFDVINGKNIICLIASMHRSLLKCLAMI
jgi:methylase of polypeptide subunit release factors